MFSDESLDSQLWPPVEGKQFIGCGCGNRIFLLSIELGNIPKWTKLAWRHVIKQLDISFDHLLTTTEFLKWYDLTIKMFIIFNFKEQIPLMLR